MSYNLEDCVAGLVCVFQKYSQIEGNKYTLTKAELKAMLQAELHCTLSESNNAKVDEFMKALDSNRDGEVDFQEFAVLVAALIILCHEFFKEYDKKQ